MSVLEKENPVTVHVEICKEGTVLPSYANVGDAGMDIRAAEDVLIAPGETKVVPTGLKIAIPNGYEVQVRPRSGLSLKTPLRISNSPGTIDSGYRNEVGIIIENSSQRLFYDLRQDDSSNEIAFREPTYPTYSIDEKGNKNGNYLVKKGDRVAQIVLAKFETIAFQLADEGSIENIGINRGGGFGSSGTK